MTITLDLADAATNPQTRRALKELSAAVVKKKKIVVVTGAGISCSCGIPDFRSSDGLYNMVKQRYPDVVMKGRDLFDASLFRDTTSTSVFYSFIAELKKKIDVASPSPTHSFIKTLDSKNKLLRSYTQNIDGLEERVGLVGSSGDAAKSGGKGKNAGKLCVKEVRNVQLHGDIHRVRCVMCSAEFPCAEEHLDAFLEGTAPDCPECLSRSEARVARSARAIRVGSLRPAIVLYDEPHPLGDDIGVIQMADVNKKPDLLIIMGTSMKVHGLKQLVKDFAKTIRSNAPSTSSTSSPSKRPCRVLFVNKTAPSSEWSDIIDYHVAGDTDAWVTKVVEDWKRIRPSDWEIQQTLDATESFKMVKATAVTTQMIKKKPSKKNDENAAPEELDLEAHAAALRLDSAPSSPTKRRQKSSHYDDVNSSPSKRQSMTSLKEVMPANERKLLFVESTNQPEPSALYDSSKMDISICPDRSMLSVEDDVILDLKRAAVKKAPTKAPSKAATTKKATTTKAAPAKQTVARSSTKSSTKPAPARRRTRASASPST